MSILWRMTGGRPMEIVRLAGRHFFTKNKVFLYRDRLGRHWFADGPWSLSRVRAKWEEA